MKHTGYAPFGFEWKGDQLRVIEKEARVRRLAFELYAELRNKSLVAKRLNGLGHHSRRGNAWRDVTVARLLLCTSARGLYPVNKTLLDPAGLRVEKPQEEWDFIECPRIVSEELWTQVQSILAQEGAPTRSKSNSMYPFTGVLFCHCGMRMNAATSSPKYVCAQCGNRIPISDLENAFLDEVTSFLRARKRAATEIIYGEPDAIAQRDFLRQAQAKVQQIDEEISKTERLYMENRISLERFEKIHRPLEDDRRAAHRALDKIKAKVARAEGKQTLGANDLSFDPSTLRKRWPEIPVNARSEIVRSFVERIVVGDDELEFSYRFRDSSERMTKSQPSPDPTTDPTFDQSEGDEPLYIRLPRPGKRCSKTGMTRSSLNELILPTERNSYRPPVESKCLRKREGGKGTRLIVWQSLKRFLDRQS